MKHTGHDEPLLSVRDLHAHFDTGDGIVQAVDGVSFDIHRGEVFSVVGESGSGKSVTAMAILQLIPTLEVDSGEILWKGEDILQKDTEEMDEIRSEARRGGKECGSTCRSRWWPKN